ncbi:MAG: cell envelope integrity protein TolA [Alphaproteobacteria bacterium]
MLSRVASGEVTPAQQQSAARSRLPMEVAEAVNDRIRPCWNVDPAALRVREMVIEVSVRMRQDQTVAEAVVVDQGRYSSDPIFRSQADAAIRAVRNPRCQPWPVAPDRYQGWPDITLNFDPSDFL